MGKRIDFIGGKAPRNKLVWVPKLASWEKEFVYKVGSFTWEQFLELKFCTQGPSKVEKWEDSAAKEAFDKAKNRFYANTKGLAHCESPTDLDPNLYIDEINEYDDKEVNHELYRELDAAKFVHEYEDEEVKVLKWWEVNDVYIKPTGWDVEPDYGKFRDLTGLIVGC